MIPSWFTELVRTATATDAQPPFSDQSLVDLRAGSRDLVGVTAADGASIGAAICSDTEIELVIAPDARRRGHGTALVERVLAREPSPTLAWAHGDHPGARILAERFGFTPVRTLLQLHASLAPNVTSLAYQMKAFAEAPPDVPGEERTAVRKRLHVAQFRPGTDDSAWLDLNARAFADHPEQGKLTQRDLDARMDEEWFNADDFLLLFAGDELVGSNWLKIDPTSDQPHIGEIYAIGIAPEHQGKGYSRVLMDAGLARLRERGATAVALYVEADNVAAIALYERYGFSRHTIDVQYSRT